VVALYELMAQTKVASASFSGFRTESFRPRFAVQLVDPRRMIPDVQGLEPPDGLAFLA
jgi:hypothetical protein